MNARFGILALFWHLLAAPLVAQPPITAVAFVPGEGAVVAGSQAGIEVRDWPELKLLRRLPTKLVNVHDLKFSPDGKTLAVVGGKAGERGEIEFISWESGQIERRLVLSEDLFATIAWQSSGGWAAAGADAAVIVALSPVAEPRRLVGHSKAVTAALFLPGEKQLLTASADHSLRLWDAASGELQRTLDNHTDAVHDLALRPQKQDDTAPPLVASAGADGTVRFWQPTIGRLVRFARLPSPPLSIAWTPAGDRCFAGCQDGSLQAIDPDLAELLGGRAAVSGWAYSIAVSPDGKFAVVGGNRGELRRVSLESLTAAE